MHPWIIRDQPGNCPICGMKLELVHSTTSTNSLGITIDPATIQLMNIQTAEAVRGPVRRNIRTVGTIDYNETALADVTVKVRGWIEKLDADATGKLVHRGEPMFEIYAPELYRAQVEFLAVADATNDASGLALRAAARDKLKWLGVSDAQITALEHSREARRTLTMVAPTDGFIIEKNVVQGQMAEAGARLYRLADLGIVWVFAQVYEQDLPAVQPGQEAVVKLTSLPDREFRGRVAYLYPTVDEKTRTARVRLEFENPGYFLKPGMFVSVQISAELSPDAVLAPSSAVLRSGTRDTVFVALPGGRFAPRTVVTGVEAENDQVEIISGLQAGERVVTSGQFMLDSESQLREAIQKMSSGMTLIPVMSPPETVGGTTNGVAAETKKAAVRYTCPMHPEVISDKPGVCPKCGMELVPMEK